MLSDSSRAQSRRQRVAPLRMAHDPQSEDTLLVHEVYSSLQGEGTRSGQRCTFVRLTGCHLRCTYCDTEHAFAGGDERALSSLISEINRLRGAHVLITGGEPLLQRATKHLVRRLCDDGNTVLIETSGGVSTARIDARAILIVDVKTPSSGEVARNIWSNLDRLRPHDEVKFVIGDEDDYRFSVDIVNTRLMLGGAPPCTILFSPVVNTDGMGLSAASLAGWMLRDEVPARLSLQLHKVIWGQKRGV